MGNFPQQFSTNTQQQAFMMPEIMSDSLVDFYWICHSYVQICYLMRTGRHVSKTSARGVSFSQQLRVLVAFYSHKLS